MARTSFGVGEMDDFRMEFVRDDGGFFAQLHGRKVPIYAEGVHDFFFRAFDAQITFATNGNGRTTGLFFHEGGADIYLNRAP